MREEDRFEGARKRRRGRKVLHIVGFAFLGIIMAALFALVFGFVVEWLWNWLMPGIFGLRQITYWQAFGLLLLAKIFFGGFRHHAPPHHDQRFKKGFFHDHAHRFAAGRWGDCGCARPDRPEGDVREEASEKTEGRPL